ncbi:protein YpmT [Bacillus sp. FJAT-53060]|uniref:protein YpmT n=1 Tax=Bacillus TaxID=1386 RepID=UPI001CFBC020|nr:protein YpmT [Bacillus stratosphericus]
MKRVYQYFSLLSLLFAVYFGMTAATDLKAENINQFYLNIAYCALFLATMILAFDFQKQEKAEDVS